MRLIAQRVGFSGHRDRIGHGSPRSGSSRWARLGGGGSRVRGNGVLHDSGAQSAFGMK